MGRSPSSLSSRSNSITPNPTAISPAPYSASPDPEWWSIDHTSAEDDDDMHDPGTARKLDRSGHAFTLRGIMNLGCVSLITAALLMLFAGYPLLEAFRKRDPEQGGSYGLGGVNATGQIPEFAINFGMIDSDTPQSAHRRTSFDGKPQVLVFSDEFNVDGRTFYPGEDPYWEAVDLHYWGTNNLEWYSPKQITTTEGKLAITLDERETHDLDYAGASIALPGTSDVWGLWPAFWTMGNLGRAAYGASLEGLWPYSYDTCDVGTVANQTYDGVPATVANKEVGSKYHEGEYHPGPIDSKTGEFVGRAAPEIDVFEAQVEIASRTGQVSQSAQWAPFNANYEFIDKQGTTYEFHNDEAEINVYLGGVFQQATSSLATTNQACYSGENPTPNGSCFSEYGVEFSGGPDGHVTWASDGEETWTLFGSAMGADPVSQIGQRPISEEPMYIILNLGISKNFGDVDFEELVFPAIMYVDWVRVYQPEGESHTFMIANIFKNIKREDNSTSGSGSIQEKSSADDDDLKPPSRFIDSPFRRPLTFHAFVTPPYPLAPSPGFIMSIRNAVCYSWLNLLLLSAPISWALHQVHISDIGTFVTSILGVVPLAALLSFATEEVALRTSVPLGGLLNATLGNLVEIIIAILALVRCEISIVQSSLLGGLLSNILLVLGMSFLAGGIKFSQQSFKQLPASINTSLLMLSVMSLMVPLAFHTILGDKFPDDPDSEQTFILQMSRGTSVILIVIYLCYMAFVFYTHQEEFLDTIDDDEDVPLNPKSSANQTNSSKADIHANLQANANSNANKQEQPQDYSRSTSISDDLEAGFKRPQLKRARTAPIIATPLATSTSNYFSSTQSDTPRSFTILVITTILLYFTCEALVDSIQGISENTSASKEWISLIILPIVGNAAEHATAVIAAAKGKQELALAVALGSTVQIAIFVIPLVVLLSWIISKPLTLVFEPMETMTLFLSVLLARFAIEDGRSHWLSGCVLFGSYFIIALVFWYFPKQDTFELIRCVA
ncbi:hypothetical protein E3P91_03710 [Wallemia ichthyophaga]|nr:hypothetical protein E3P91_03710 [Wallemia ichthyophaga]TIA78860.1 hypothetical protein E3P98_03630 [Wallemia ichthyophaga]TIB59067.1 hypothetical protein E3P78_03690 [Wallemia ichthyophaga]